VELQNKEDIASEMDRILTNLKSSKEISTGYLTANWKEAFELYRKVKGVVLCGTCSKDFQRASDWLTGNE
jgi:hypothetical protein